jgi:hypothetical protein
VPYVRHNVLCFERNGVLCDVYPRGLPAHVSRAALTVSRDLFFDAKSLQQEKHCVDGLSSTRTLEMPVFAGDCPWGTGHALPVFVGLFRPVVSLLCAAVQVVSVLSNVDTAKIFALVLVVLLLAPCAHLVPPHAGLAPLQRRDQSPTC